MLATQPRNGRSQFQAPEPDLACAEEASEESQAMHMDDAADLQALGEVTEQLESVTRDATGLLGHLHRGLRKIEHLMTQIEDLENKVQSLERRIFDRQAAHIQGHRTISGVLERRQRRQRVTVIAPGADVEVNGAEVA